MLYLGANIREHRMKKDLTQEQLAYHLGVSSQTVSRWENGTTYPDIVMLPVLADYFDISIDMLMGYAKECAAEEREQFFADIQSLETRQKIRKIRDMLQIYPNDVYLQFSLANTLYSSLSNLACSSDVRGNEQDNAEIENEISLLCSRILQSDKPGMQCGAIRLLAILAAKRGDTKSAMNYVNELPSVYCGREVMAERVLHGLKFKQAIRKIFASSDCIMW